YTCFFVLIPFFKNRMKRFLSIFYNIKARVGIIRYGYTACIVILLLGLLKTVGVYKNSNHSTIGLLFSQFFGTCNCKSRDALLQITFVCIVFIKRPSSSNTLFVDDFF